MLISGILFARNSTLSTVEKEPWLLAFIRVSIIT